MPPGVEALARRLRRQAASCADLGSPLYALLLEAAAEDLEVGGPVADVLAGYEEEPGRSALALRLMGADVATVVYHSVFLQYVDEPGRRRIDEALASAPVFHLRMEPGEGTFEIRLDDELLGTCRAHGTGVRWLVDSG